MIRIKKAISVLLVLTLVFGINIVSLAYPEIKSVFTGLFAVNAGEVEDMIMN